MRIQFTSNEKRHRGTEAQRRASSLKPQVSSLLFLSVSLCLGGVLSAADSKLFVTNSEGDDLTIVDPVTLRVTGTMKVGRNPHGVTYARVNDRLYVSTEYDRKVLAIDPWKEKILAGADVGVTPNQITVTADGNFVYVPLRGEAGLDIVDTRPMKVIKHYPLEEWPHNSYTAADGSRVYVTTIVGKTIHAYDPKSHEELFVIRPGGEVRPLALTRDGRTIYAALSGLHGFAVVDVAQRQTVRRVELPSLPPNTPKPFLDTYTHGLALTPDEKELWVTSCPGGKVYVYSVPELKLLGSVPVGNFPNWMSFRPDGKVLFVSNTGSNSVTAIDVPGRRVLATIPVGASPKRLLVVAK